MCGNRVLLCMEICEELRYNFDVVSDQKIDSCQGEKQMSEKIVFGRGSFFHGTRADLKMGEFIEIKVMYKCNEIIL